MFTLGSVLLQKRSGNLPSSFEKRQWSGWCGFVPFFTGGGGYGSFGAGGGYGAFNALNAGYNSAAAVQNGYVNEVGRSEGFEAGGGTVGGGTEVGVL